MPSRQDIIAKREHAVEYLREHVTPETVLYTHVDYGRGETDYVTVYIAPAAGEIVDISYYVAAARERRMTQRGIAYGGGQYSKGLEAADDACNAAGIPLDQIGHWRELH